MKQTLILLVTYYFIVTFVNCSDQLIFDEFEYNFDLLDDSFYEETCTNTIPIIFKKLCVDWNQNNDFKFSYKSNIYNNHETNWFYPNKLNKLLSAKQAENYYNELADDEYEWSIDRTNTNTNKQCRSKEMIEECASYDNTNKMLTVNLKIPKNKVHLQPAAHSNHANIYNVYDFAYYDDDTQYEEQLEFNDNDGLIKCVEISGLSHKICMDREDEIIFSAQIDDNNEYDVYNNYDDEYEESLEYLLLSFIDNKDWDEISHINKRNDKFKYTHHSTQKCKSISISVRNMQVCAKKEDNDNYLKMMIKSSHQIIVNKYNELDSYEEYDEPTQYEKDLMAKYPKWKTGKEMQTVSVLLKGPLTAGTGSPDNASANKKKWPTQINAALQDAQGTVIMNIAASNPLPAAGRTYDQGDAGHMVARQLGGPAGVANIVPQNPTQNQSGDWHKFEENVKKYVNEHAGVTFTYTVTPVYGDIDNIGSM